MIYAVNTTAFMLSQQLGETRTQEEIAAAIIRQNEREELSNQLRRAATASKEWTQR